VPTRPFADKIESWSYAPINDTELVGKPSAARLALKPLRKVADDGSRVAKRGH